MLIITCFCNGKKARTGNILNMTIQYAQIWSVEKAVIIRKNLMPCEKEADDTSFSNDKDSKNPDKDKDNFA